MRPDIHAAARHAVLVGTLLHAVLAATTASPRCSTHHPRAVPTPRNASPPPPPHHVRPELPTQPARPCRTPQQQRPLHKAFLLWCFQPQARPPATATWDHARCSSLVCQAHRWCSSMLFCRTSSRSSGPRVSIRAFALALGPAPKKQSDEFGGRKILRAGFFSTFF